MFITGHYKHNLNIHPLSGDLWHDETPEWFLTEETTAGATETPGAGETTRGAET